MNHLRIEILSATRARITKDDQVLYNNARHAPVEVLADVLRQYGIAVEVINNMEE